ncbi:MAG: exodeoxyribonuclease VII large subunit [Candidatus Obscuribacterales bacterium]|nr:exodeoxyribonuclease VII large subunit [Candidatus Obscuribacterales bacterium]
MSVPQPQFGQLNPVLTVSEFTGLIKDVLEETFDAVAIVGEISNAKLYPSGHWYFSLKDKDATISCVCFRNAAQYLKFELEDGLQVVAKGKISVYPPRGNYQIVVTGLEPVGIGQWQLAFEQLREKLDKEGLLDPERKRPIPATPRCVGVVTSIAGAALRDILSVFKRRNPGLRVIISPSKVQGEGSAEEIAQAIESLNEVPGVDAIIVARGGGSIEDLWSFNTEIVARAVAASGVPTISGVGHETDVTICDLVADLRAPTPTAAAELVSRGHMEMASAWTNLHRRLLDRITEKLATARYRFEKADPWPELLRYADRLQHLHLKLQNLRHKLLNTSETLLAENKHRWTMAYEKLMVLGPLNVLQRGFAVIRNKDGEIITKAHKVKEGDTVEALLAKGKLKLKVIECESDWY